MTDANSNGIDDAIEDSAQVEAYKARAVSAKFKQQVSYGVGAAMVFGLVSAFAGYLVGLVKAGAAVTTAAPVAAGAVSVGSSFLPILGLVALGVVGVGLLYLSAKYLSENTVLDQALQAKQISAATHGKAPAIDPVATGKTNNFPTPMALAERAEAGDISASIAANENTPATTVTAERGLADTIVARGAANENTPPDMDKANASWEEKTTALDEAQSVKARG